MIDPKKLRIGDVVVFGNKVERRVRGIEYAGIWFFSEVLDPELFLRFESSFWHIADTRKETWELAWDELNSRYARPPYSENKSVFKEIWNKYMIPQGR